MITSPGAPKTVICFAAKSADEVLGPWIDVRGYTNIAFFLVGNGTTSSGVVSIEETAPVSTADNAPVYGADTGKYSLITTINASDVTGDAQKGVHLTPAAYAFVRGRISTVIGGGGTVTLTLVAS